MARRTTILVSLVVWSAVPNTLGWTTSSSSSRRELLENVAVAGAAAILLGQSPAAWALEEEPPSPPENNVRKKPFAPIEQLLPAARVKWTIDQAVRIAAGASSTEEDWERLQELLLIPQNYTDNRLPDVPTAPAKAYLDAYQRNREQLNVLEKPGAMLVQNGEIAAWKRLKRQERAREEQDEVRAALNLYTSSLTFSAESYLLNVPLEERKKMIRQDRLPDVKQVVQSDMGVRYLARNELLTAMDEAKAELEYQLKEENKSNQELLGLLQKAQSACDQWFALIEEQDVEEAMRLIKFEKGRLSA